MDEIDTTNKFAVASTADAVHFMRPVPSRITKQDALLLAAYLVAMADDDGDFAELLDAVQNT